VLNIHTQIACKNMLHACVLSTPAHEPDCLLTLMLLSCCLLQRSAIPLSAVQGCIDWAQSSSGEILSKLLKDILETGSQAAPIAFALELSANINGVSPKKGTHVPCSTCDSATTLSDLSCARLLL
jgi:hypothetical protein